MDTRSKSLLGAQPARARAREFGANGDREIREELKMERIELGERLPIQRSALLTTQYDLVIRGFGLTLRLLLGATGFDVGGETPGACRVVSNS